MAWERLGTQFALELALGVLVALGFVPRAPVGPFFYRLMGSAALVPALLAVLFPLLADRASAHAWQLGATSLAVLCYPVYAGPVRGRRWGVALALAITGLTLGLGLQVRDNLGPDVGRTGWLAATATALATGCVTGSVGLAMVLGHWYLTVPTLQIRHLRRLNRVSAICMLLCLCSILVSCAVFAEVLRNLDRSLFDAWGLFHLGTRVAVGLAFPLLFAWMAAQSLLLKNTRSATGILYASTVLVLIGAAASISLQDTYGVPL
jgi:cytochrome bd-type quinol oxidase subunit 2